MPLSAWNFKSRGTPEHVLMKAGLVTVTSDGGGDYQIAPAPVLAAMFRDQKVPPLEEVVPQLSNLVVAHAYDQSGILDGSTLRMNTVGTLRTAGMTDAGFATFDKAIAQTANDVRAELAESRQATR